MSANPIPTAPRAAPRAAPRSDAAPGAGIEVAGLEVIAEGARRGRPAGLFWPWFAANVSVFGISYGAFVLGFGISFWQAAIVGVIGIVVSFLFCGIVALAGKRGSAPTMVLSRAIFGVRGNRLVGFLSWLLTVGWETVLTVLAVLATSTVVTALGGDGDSAGVKVVALVVIAGIVVAAGVFGFGLIIRLQTAITIITGVATVAYLALVLPGVDLAAVAALPVGGAAALVGALVFMLTGFGLGWVNAAADYSRYLPRASGSVGVVAWTTVGGAAAPVVLLVAGLLVAGSSPELSAAIGADPIGALTTLLPTWFLVPFALVAILGLIGGAVLDIYSSGLALLSLGLPVRRPVAAGIDGALMIVGAAYVVFVAQDFVGPFQGFLITLGVPIAAWCGVFLADVALRRRDYADAELYTPSGRYGDIRWGPVLLVVGATAIGWGLVANTFAPWLGWQGYLLDLVGAREAWGGANLGVLIALVIGFVGYVLIGRGAVRRQEAPDVAVVGSAASDPPAIPISGRP